MQFIVTRFLRMIVDNYRFNYTISRQQDGSYLCTITGIPIDLIDTLSKLTYLHITGQKHIYDKNNNFVRTETTSKEVNICRATYNSITNVNGIIVVFNEDTYAEKCNKLDYAFRRYYETHSLIDMINQGLR